MKIVYLSTPFYADCDFPLVREWQLQGHEVYYFIELASFSMHANIINIKKQIQKNIIVQAVEYEEINFFKDYISLEKVFVVNRIHKKKIHPQNIKLSLEMNKFIKKICPDVICTTTFIEILNPFICLFRKKIILTVHDPFPHTGENSLRNRISYKLTMNIMRKFVILNEKLRNQFIEYYKIEPNNVCLNKLGPYTCTNLFFSKTSKQKKNNILFYGRISPYKGVEYLCKAMIKVHEVLPDATLTIVGGGEIYFDISPYIKLPYFEIMNHYVDMNELASLLNRCSVNVCPYTDATQSGVVLTTYAMERPIIATRVGSMAEYIEDGKTGYLVEPRNVSQLANAIIDLLSNREKLYTMINNIKLNNHSESNGWAGIARKYINFFEQ